jgi:acetolactate synthase regulatory subunit
MHHTHHLHLTVGPEPGVLDRIVGACRARRCVILALHFLAADAHAPGAVRLSVSAPPARVDLLAARLAGLVDVRAVEHEHGPRRARPTAHAPRLVSAERRR